MSPAKDWNPESYARFGGLRLRPALDLLAHVGKLPGGGIVDLGCGNGMIAEYISDVTDAHVTGLDYIPTAIAQAQARTAAKADRLTFPVGDINAPAGELTMSIRKELTDIQYGRQPDRHGWLTRLV